MEFNSTVKHRKTFIDYKLYNRVRTMKKYSLISLFLVFFLFLPVRAIEETYRCINDTHLEIALVYTDCDGTCTDKNITQVVNCTMPVDSIERCDKSVNQCKYFRESEMGDVVAMTVVSFTISIFFILGFKIQPNKEFSLMKNGMQILFMNMGLWLLILDMGIAETVAVSTGVSENTLDLVHTGISVVSYGIYFIMVLLMLSYLVSVLWAMVPEKMRGGRR